MDGFNTPDGRMHPQDRRNLIIFAVLSILVWFGYDHYVLGPKLEKLQAQREAIAQLPSLAQATGVDVIRPREAVIAATARVPVRNDRMFGSISLTGGRLDDMHLTEHFKTLEKTENVVLLSPAGAPHAQYVEMGWLPGDNLDAAQLPDRQTQWRFAEGSARELTPASAVTLYWENGRGLRFERLLTVDNDAMVHVKQTVINKTAQDVTLYPYAMVAQRGLPEEFYGKATVHEGAIGYIGGKLVELDYKKLSKNPREEYQADSGWIGITSKYWLTNIVPAQDEQAKYRFLYTAPAYVDQEPLYQADVVGAPRVVAAGGSAYAEQHIFTGAKKISMLRQYEKELGVRHFDLAVDFGLWYFLTKPLFYLLDFLAGHVGNFGIAIIILTIMVRFAVFPLANASYRSFAKMRKVAPQMQEIREKYADDKVALQKALMELYKTEKVNPMAGCLPLLVQIPIFFALFKVFSVTIEMRHAPFFGWIHDLSQPDPTTIFNLFGLIPWNPPAFLMIGAWPCLMLAFMLLQKRMNPPPQDKTQAILMNFMPFFITYILSGFASGLVVYWTFGNLFSMIQQYIIMRSMGVEVGLFKRSKVEKELAQEVKDGPAVHPGLALAEEKIEEALEEVAHHSEKPISPPKPRKKKKR